MFVEGSARTPGGVTWNPDIDISITYPKPIELSQTFPHVVFFSKS